MNIAEVPPASKKDEPQESVRKEKNSDSLRAMNALFKAAEGFVGKIDPGLTVELTDGNDNVDKIPHLRVLYQGRRLTGYVPNLTNVGGTYRPGGVFGDIESGQFQRDLTQIIEDELRMRDLGKYNNLGKSPEDLAKEKQEEDYQKFKERRGA